MYAGNESHKDTLHVSPHIAAHKSSSPGPLSAHIPTYRMGAEDIPLYRIGAQSVLNLKSNDVQSSQGVPCSSGNSISHLLKNGPRDLTAHSTSLLSEKCSTSVGALSSPSIHYQKSSPHIHTVVSQGMPSTQLPPAHITERTSYYRVPDSVIGIQAPSAILVSTNVDSHLSNSHSSQASNLGHNGPSQNLGITSTTGVLSTPLPAHLSSSFSSSNGSTTQISPGTIFKVEKNAQHIENLTSMAPHTPPPQQDHLQIQHQHQHNQQSQSYPQESRQHQRQQEQEQRQQHPHQAYEQQPNQQQQIPQQHSVHHQQQPQQQSSSSMPQQRNDLVQQALRAVSSNPNQTGNDKEVLEYNYTAGDIAELLMMNIQGNALLQASKKQPGTNTSIVTPVTSVTTGPLSDINNESQVVLLQPAAIDETNCLQPQLPLSSKQKHKPPAEDQQDKRIKIAERMRNKRADENEEAKAVRRQREAERMRRKRASEDEETKVKRRQEAAVRARQRRATMSDEERVVDRKRAAERMRLRRKTEDDHQKAIRRMKAAERMRARRALETPEQRAARRANMSEKMKILKARRKTKSNETNDDDCSTDNIIKPTFSQSDSEARGETLVELPEVTIERSSLQRAQLERTQQILRSQEIERPQIQQRVIHSHAENQTFNNDLKIDFQQHKFDLQSKYKIEGVKIENVNDSRIIVPTSLAQSSGLTLVQVNDYPINSTISATSTPTTLSTVDLSQLSGQSSSILNNKTLISNKEVVQLSETQLPLNNKALPSNQELNQQIVQPLSLSTKSLSTHGPPQVSGQLFSAISGNVKSFSTLQELSHLSGHQMPVNSKTLPQETTQILLQSVSSESKTISRQTVNIKPLSVNQPLSQLEQTKAMNSKTLSSVQEITQICGQAMAGNFKSFSSNSELLQFGQPLIINAKSLSSIQGMAQVSGQPFIITKSISSNLDQVQTEQQLLVNDKPLLSNQSLGQPVTFMAKNSSNNQESINWMPLSRNFKTLPSSNMSEKPITSANIISSNEELPHSSQPLSLTARISSKYDTSHGHPLSFNLKKIVPVVSETKQEITEPLPLQKYQQVRQTESKSSSPQSIANVLASGGTSIATMASTSAPLELSYTKHHQSTISANVIASGGTSIATRGPSTSTPIELSYTKHQQSTSANHHPSILVNHHPSTSSNHHPQQQSLTHVNFQQQQSSQLHVQQRHQQT